MRRDADNDDSSLHLNDNDSQTDDYLTVNVLSKANVFLMGYAQDGNLEDSLTELSADDIDKFFQRKSLSSQVQ